MRTHPIAMLGGLWEELRAEWAKTDDETHARRCSSSSARTRAIAKVIYEWLAEDKPPTGIPPAKIDGLPQHATAR